MASCASLDPQKKVWMVTGSCFGLWNLRFTFQTAAILGKCRPYPPPRLLNLRWSGLDRYLKSNLFTLCAGTSSGFGKRLVPIILARGDYVIATVRKPEDFQVVVSESDVHRVHIILLDLKESEQSIKEKVKGALAKWGRVDVLINNAGTAPKGLLPEGGAEFFMEHLQINVIGTMSVTNAVLSNMRERRTGTVVFLGSRSAWRPDIILAGYYSAWKAAIHSLGASYAAELERFGVRVTVFCPGGFRTENIHTWPILINDHIPEYDALREETSALFNANWKKAPGDPVKAMELLVDVVNGEGKAAGKKFPLYLPVGNATFDAARAYWQNLSQTMDEWEDVAKNLNFDEEE
ncbi:uncharacterized protein FIBRA_03743 [Fibroporia radiculosa]|uniref:Uncharacterized protein n=1 Tax=Fibroporia radiculosa TaxID=599839 RepID=J4H2K4_9APHY|nr:uncharacterized protein FIBRA_03743 [Fibroporia radiculosa]CCM01679.1 predicted protein [Fibroporia radiculosa]